MEARLREGLRLLAEEAPELGAARPRKPRVGRIVAAAAVVVVASGVAYGLVRSDDSGTGGQGSADCVSPLRYEGRSYMGHGAMHRVPAPGEALGEGVITGCDEGRGRSEDRAVDVLSFPGVEPADAVLVMGHVFVRVGLDSLPHEVALTDKYVPCEFEQSRAVVGEWLSVQGPRKPRFDGDLRLPFRIEFRTADPRFVGKDYETVTLLARAADDLVPPTVAVVDRLLWQGEDAEVVLRCDGDAFLADVLRPAR